MLAMSMLLTSCIGSFPLFNKTRSWNENVGRKGVNELVFVAFWVVPVYPVTLLSDLVVLNSIEFWSGTNPLAKGTKKINTESGTYLVKCDGTGYDIVGADGQSLRLDFYADENTWTITDPATNETHMLFAWVDENHVKMPLPDGRFFITELSDAGLMAYTEALQSHLLAQN